MTPPAVGALLSACFCEGGECPSEVAIFVHRRANGHPTVAREVAAAALQASDLVIADDSLRFAAGRIVECSSPPTMQAQVAEMLDVLTPPLRSAITAAAIIGENITAEDVEAVSGRRVDAMVMRRLIELSLLVMEGGVISFCWPAMSHVICQMLPRAKRCELHAVMFDRLRGRSGRRDALRAVHHAYMAGRADAALALVDKVTPAAVEAACVGEVRRLFCGDISDDIAFRLFPALFPALQGLFYAYERRVADGEATAVSNPLGGFRGRAPQQTPRRVVRQGGSLAEMRAGSNETKEELAARPRRVSMFPYIEAQREEHQEPARKPPAPLRSFRAARHSIDAGITSNNNEELPPKAERQSFEGTRWKAMKRIYSMQARITAAFRSAVVPTNPERNRSSMR
jgi:hypothetical protein